MLPLDQRQSTAVILFRIRKSLHDVIPTQGPVISYRRSYLELCSIFTRLPLAVRKNLKAILINILEQNIDSPPFLLTLCSTCLCLLELVAIRNVDRIDLEANDVHETVLQLNRLIIPKLTEKVLGLRTNMPRLEAWSLGMIVFTYKACIECLSSQLTPFDKVGEEESFKLNYDRSVITHTAMPVVLSQFLQSQSKHRPYPKPPAPYKLFEFLFSCSVSTNYDLMSQAQGATTFDPNVSPLELSEPPLPRKRTRVIPPKENKLVTIFISDLPKEELETELVTASTKRILLLLHQLVDLPPETVKNSPDSTPPWVGALRCTPHILTKFLHKQKKANSSGKKSDSRGQLYEEAHSLLLQLWYRASEQRLLFGLPQSYLWLTELLHPDFEVSHWYTDLSLGHYLRLVVTSSHKPRKVYYSILTVENPMSNILR